MQSETVTIYALSEPSTPSVIRYVGKTRKELHRRLTEHVAERNRKNYRCHRRTWLNSLFRRGVRPLIWAIEQCRSEGWEEREKYWIAFFRPLGLLTNSTDGGEGGLGNAGWKWKPEALDRISRQRRGCPVSPQSLENLKKGWGHKRTPEEAERVRQSLRGQKRTPEQIQNMRLARIGKKYKPRFSNYE